MTDRRRRHMVLTMFMHAAGYHNYAWRHPESRADEYGRLGLILDLTLAAEKAGLDAVFFADNASAQPVLTGDVKVAGYYEPITALSALASRTERIGLIGTASTTWSHPYTLARQFAGLDTLSGGRAGWNIVTSFIGNENYGLDEMPPPQERYRRAHEFVDVARRLWRSWDEDAVVVERESGRWADPARLHRIDHDGEFFRVQGPLNMPRSPQTGPVLVQAGSSGPGVDLGATYAELIYTVQPVRDKSIAFYAEYKDNVASKGRAPHDVAILPGIMPILGATEAEARELAAVLDDLVDLEHGRAQVESALGIPLSDLDLDEPIPAERFDTGTPASYRFDIFKTRTLREGYTLRRLIVDLIPASGHQRAVGTPAHVADLMIDWFESRACDGFSLNAPSVPEGYRRICELLIPELQERGYFREGYPARTLRDNLLAGRD